MDRFDPHMVYRWIAVGPSRFNECDGQCQIKVHIFRHVAKFATAATCADWSNGSEYWFGDPLGYKHLRRFLIKPTLPFSSVCAMVNLH